MIAWHAEKKIELEKSPPKAGGEVRYAVCWNRPPQEVLLWDGDG